MCIVHQLGIDLKTDISIFAFSIAKEGLELFSGALLDALTKCFKISRKVRSKKPISRFLST